MKKSIRRFLKNKLSIVGLIITIVVVLAALFAPQLTPHDYVGQDLTRSLLPPFWNEGGDTRYPLGTDLLGRDLLTRVLYGARVSLAVGFSAVILAGSIGITLGMLAGYFGGWFENVVMRLVDIQLAFPPVFLAIALMAVVGQTVTNMVLVLGFVTWVQYARVARGSTLSVKEKEYVEAANALGATSGRVILRHVLPNMISPLIVIAMVSVSAMIKAEAALSFLGIGIQPPTPAWGSMLASGREVSRVAWWNAVFPGLAIVVTVVGVNLLGEGIKSSTGGKQ